MKVDMSLNRDALMKRMNEVFSNLLHEKGYISFVDILMRMEKLKKADYERWRFGKVPCLEQVITLNLAKLNTMLRTLHENARRGGLKPSRTVYKSWGKGPKRLLLFSKSGDPKIEAAYSLHFLKPGERHKPVAQPDGEKDDLSLSRDRT